MRYLRQVRGNNGDARGFCAASLSDVAASEIHALGDVRQSKALKHGNDVRYTVARVNNNASEEALGVQRQHSLHSDVHGAEVVALKHGLHHIGAVGHGVHGRFSEHDAAILLAGVNAEARERVVPHVKHVLPAAHDALVHRVGNLQHMAVLLALVPNHNVLDLRLARVALLRSQNRAPDHGWKGAGGKVIGRKTRLHETGAVVHNENLCHAGKTDLVTNQAIQANAVQQSPPLFGANFALGPSGPACSSHE